MDAIAGKDWKSSVGFPINYDSAQSSDDDFDSVVVLRRRVGPRSSGHLLQDGGDGAPADLLGTTPPRARIRNKEKRRSHIFMDGEGPVPRVLKDNRRNTTNNLYENTAPIQTPDRSRSFKRASLKLVRGRERDWKLGAEHEPRADSLPSPAAQVTAPPTFVESCSRFMSLSSRLKCRTAEAPAEPPETLPPSRVHFHNTFSMLISMGNVDRGCRRTISREEQVWQNELKDLIWLELQARLAGRSLSQQDAFLCSQRLVVPAVITNIINYRFVNEHPCPRRPRRASCGGADLADGNEDEFIDERSGGCVQLECGACAAAAGAALREVGTLLDSFHHAVALFPSGQAMTTDHPLAATAHFNDKLKAMCLWYNTASHLRMKTLCMRRLVRAVRRPDQPDSSTGSVMESASEVLRSCQVRFQLDEERRVSGDSGLSRQNDSSVPTTPEPESGNGVGGDIGGGGDGGGGGGGGGGGDSGCGGTVDTTSSAESGYLSEREASDQTGGEEDLHSDLANLRLLNKCKVSPYRHYLHELLKTQGIRRSIMFVDTMRRGTLHRVTLTLQRPQEDTPYDDESEKNDETLEEDEKTEHKTNEDDNQLKRYGWWSGPSAATRLPSYRGQYLLLSALCVEVAHAYLELRLEELPRNPSSFTVKQIVHELKEGLDIATEMRATFVENVEVALDGYRAGRGARRDLLLIIRTFDATVDAVLKQYLAYLTLTAQEKVCARAHWEREWSFASRLAQRVPCAAAAAPEAFTDIVCSQLTLVVRRFEQKFIDLSRHEEHAPSREDDEDAKRRFVYAICREAQCIYTSEREATLQAVQLARVTAARLAARPKLRRRITESLMSIRNVIAGHTQTILERSSSQEKLASWETSDTLAMAARARELLLQVYKLGFELHRELHRYMNTWSDRGRGGGGAGRGRCRRLTRAESTVEDYDDRPFGVAPDAQQNQSRLEQLLSDSPSPPSPSLTEEEGEGEERGAAGEVARAVISYARCWMRFVVERCDRGRGLRPRWASQGLEFLMLACDPHNTRYLSDDEFEELKSEMDSCISHVIGSRPAPRAAEPAARRPHRIHSPLSIGVPPNNGGVGEGGGGGGKDAPTPPTPPSEPQPLLNYHGVENTAFSQRVASACRQLDLARHRQLVSLRAVGGEVSAAPRPPPRLRQVTFKWQRGLKIGQGTFGKVYTVINTETGQLLAMKELSIAAGDRRALQRAANELRVLEGVIHPHLVRHHGCELHREEMLIFMELCVEGSLEALLATQGALQEPAARRYTRQLLAAVAELHHRQIVHRDIKSGNIFLTNEGHCLKLGDFGCAVKIRANTTAVGELQGTVGTQAYMAPEVFMKSSGHGRAADVWSLGCVVTEMASGKRPFSEYDSNYQIMFMVGMGGRPEIPPALSEEGQQFCRACLTHEPELRPRAEDLMTHHFLNMKSEDDCQCEPGFLITKM